MSNSCTGCQYLSPVNNNDGSMAYNCLASPPGIINVKCGRPINNGCPLKPMSLNDVHLDKPTLQ